DSGARADALAAARDRSTFERGRRASAGTKLHVRGRETEPAPDTSQRSEVLVQSPVELVDPHARRALEVDDAAREARDAALVLPAPSWKCHRPGAGHRDAERAAGVPELHVPGEHGPAQPG